MSLFLYVFGKRLGGKPHDNPKKNRAKGGNQSYKMAVCSMIEDFEVILEEVCVLGMVFG